MTDRPRRPRRFGRADALDMRRRMAEWLAGRQVRSGKSRFRGCVHFPTEDRYCNRDTACAAASFMRSYRATGDGAWLERAGLARDHVLRVQGDNGGYPEMRGREPSDGGSTVNTAIVAENLIAAYDLGLPRGAADLDALARMADFELALEWKPGAFYHDTNHLSAYRDHRTGARLWGAGGSRLDCQNTTGLAAMMLPRIADLLARAGRTPKPAWTDAAGRAAVHLLEGQGPDGHWPYFAGGRGFDVGHHSMCAYALARAAGYLPHRTGSAVRRALARAARWTVTQGLLQTKRGSKINWAISHSACVYFTTEYFLTAAPLARAGAAGGPGAEVFRREALELLRYVRTDLWDNEAYESEGPFRLSEAYVVSGYAWFGQSMGWALWQLDDLIETMGWGGRAARTAAPRPGEARCA